MDTEANRVLETMEGASALRFKDNKNSIKLSKKIRDAYRHDIAVNSPTTIIFGDANSDLDKGQGSSTNLSAEIKPPMSKIKTALKVGAVVAGTLLGGAGTASLIPIGIDYLYPDSVETQAEVTAPRQENSLLQQLEDKGYHRP